MYFLERSQLEKVGGAFRMIALRSDQRRKVRDRHYAGSTMADDGKSANRDLYSNGNRPAGPRFPDQFRQIDNRPTHVRLQANARAFRILVADQIDELKTFPYFRARIRAPQDARTSDITTAIVEVLYHSQHLLVSRHLGDLLKDTLNRDRMMLDAFRRRMLRRDGIVILYSRTSRANVFGTFEKKPR